MDNFDPGRFDKRIEIQSATETQDAIGGITETWATLGKRWAAIDDLSGREFFGAHQTQAQVTTRIILREQYDGLNNRHRLKYGDRIFNVGSVIHCSARTAKHGQEVMCIEVISD